MKEIFTDIYNKVIGFFKQTEQQENAKDIACNRLRVVLMQDRTNLTPELMERMRKELVELLSKYLEMDKEALELNLEQDGEQVALMLSIPVLRAKDEEEIQAALEAESTTSKEEEIIDADENAREDEAAEEPSDAETSPANQKEEPVEDEFEKDACDCGKCEKCNPKQKN